MKTSDNILYNLKQLVVFLKKLSVYIVFILFLSNFLFPQFVDSLSENSIELTDNYIESDIEGENSEQENETEEIEDAEADDFFQENICSQSIDNLMCSPEFLSNIIFSYSFSDIPTPPPELS